MRLAQPSLYIHPVYHALFIRFQSLRSFSRLPPPRPYLISSLPPRPPEQKTVGQLISFVLVVLKADAFATCEQHAALKQREDARHEAAPGPADITLCHAGSERERGQQVQQKHGAASREEQRVVRGTQDGWQIIQQTTIRRNGTCPAQSQDVSQPVDCPVQLAEEV